MISRARRIIRLVERESLRRERSLEGDPDLKGVRITVLFGGRSGCPVRGKYEVFSEMSLDPGGGDEELD